MEAELAFVKGALLLLRKLALEMTFNILMTKRVSCLGQYDRIDDLITCKLSGDECSVSRQFLVDEFHFSAVIKCFDPLFVWHFRISSGKDQSTREYTLFGARNLGWGDAKSPSRDSGIRWCTEDYNGDLPLAASFCPNEQLLHRLTEEGENVLDLPLYCLHQPNNT